MTGKTNTNMPSDVLLSLNNVTKEYRGVAAIHDVSFDLKRGECHALLGENGAGKSTLSKLISGVVEPTSGEVFLNGKPLRISTPAEAQKNGIVMVHQETSLVPSMTVAQNLFLGDEQLFNRMRPLNIAAQVFLSSLNFDVNPLAGVDSLGAAKKQMVEIARAVRQRAKIIIFDEPTATLTPEEKSHFFALLTRLKNDGVSVIFISHALEEALYVADRITVLRDGELVVTDQASAFDRDKIVRAMVGRDLKTQLYSAEKRKNRPRGKEVLGIRNLSMGKVVRNNSFTVYKGQVTGIFGLVGSGRTETAKIISGVAKRDFFYGGEVLLEGRSIRYRVPQQGVQDGIVYVTEDRKVEGFFETMSITENLGIAELAVDSTAQFTNQKHMHRLFQHWTKKLDIKAINEDSKVVELSGGNQQKVVIARSLLQEPKIIFMDEPTRGVDVGAIAEIHQAINDLADEGCAVVVISSYLPEILNISDRILVARAGRIVEEFSPETADEEMIMYAAVH